MKSINAAYSLGGLPKSFSLSAACRKCLNINIGCRVLRPDTNQTVCLEICLRQPVEHTNQSQHSIRHYHTPALAPLLNHAGCIITNSRVFSILFFSLQAIHGTADSKLAVAVRVCQRPLFIQWAQPSMLPASRHASCVHHELQQLSYERNKNIDAHLTSTLIWP